MQERSSQVKPIEEVLEKPTVEVQKTKEPKKPRELNSKESFILELIELLDTDLHPENDKIYFEKVIDVILRNGMTDISIEKFVEKNFGSLIREFPELRDKYIEFTKDKRRRDRNRAKRMRRK
jgi:hypothetical protein